MNIQEILTEEILVEGRIRHEVGDTDDIEETIQEEGIGQINPITIKETPGAEFPYKLIAGGRRLAAHQRAEIPIITANVYPENLTQKDEITIELTENLARLDLRWDEVCKGITKLHNLLTEKEDVLIESEELDLSGEDVRGWSVVKTAESLGLSKDNVYQAIRLSESLEAFPELERCRTKKEALNLEARIIEQGVLAEKAKRAKDQVGFDDPEFEGESEEIELEGEEILDVDRAEALKTARRRIMGSYKLGDFFDLIKEIPDQTFDLVEFDPDYGIEGVSEDFGSKSSEGVQDLIMKDYQAVSTEAEVYLTYIKKALDKIDRVMKDDSWLIMWFSPSPWFEPIALLLEEKGFQFKRLPGAWFKDVDAKASMAPDRYLGRTMEYFFYARKGKAEIIKRARGECFTCKVNSALARSHPTEKPIKLMQEILSTFTTPGAKVLVPHAGSGNTLFAAANLSMKALGIDISEAYKDKFDSRCIMWEPGSGEI